MADIKIKCNKYNRKVKYNCSASILLSLLDIRI